MKIKCVLIMILFPFLLIANIIEIEKPIIEKNAFQNDLPITMASGKPAMPYIPVKILLPMGEKLSGVRIELLNQSELLTNQHIDYARTPQPISLAGPDNTKKDEEIYTSNQYYPVEDYILLGVQRVNGYDIALVNIFPYKYNPVKSEVIWFKNAEIGYSSESDLSVWEKQNEVLIKNEKIESRISDLVVNNEELSSYRKHGNVSNRSLVDPSDPYSLIIITDSEREPYFDDFVTWKNNHGITSAVFLTSDIYNEYTGVNDQEMIKNFIYDAYTTYSGTATPLEYVILGGDDEIIPIRTVYINTGYGTIDWNMPCDLYYGCLDNDWDGDGDGIYGEIEDNVDLVPEVSIGRIPAETELEFTRFFHKTYQYVDETTVSNDIAYLLGENLNWNPVTWGGDYKDEVAMLTPSLEQDYHVFRLFDREGTFSSYNVKEAINNGVNIMNHMGHSNENMVFGQNISHTASYTNTEYGFAYTQGCYPAAFDEATSQTSESIGENLVFCEGGLFAFVGNTRYGWYSPGSTNGPSQPYDIEFFDAIFNENIRQLGKALDESRIVLANQAMSNTFLRWVHYELVLFGDPSVEVKVASGEFPYLFPVSEIYDDTELGDGDGTPNPGEQIEIYIELENMEGWADASDVTATISFEDPTIQVLVGNVNYGSIPNGTTLTADPFVVQVPQNCNYDSYEYTLQVFAPVSGGNSFNKSFELSFEVSLFQQYWPWTTNNSILSNPVICDFDGNNSKELMIVDAFANVNLLDIEAQQIPGYPWMNDVGMWRSTALGDINNDENLEIVFATRDGRIFALDNNGDMVFEFQHDNEQLLTPILTDIDGDNNYNILSFSIDKKIFALNASGDLLPNFPVEMSELSLVEMASADINQDGCSEILIATLDGLLNALDSSGENINGFPVNLATSFCSSPIILDNLKIVIGTYDNKIHIVSSSGEILLSMDIEHRIACSPIAADFDNDNILEIAFATITGKLYIIEQDGTILNGWPVDIGNSVAKAPLAADLDNDNDLELLCFTSTNDLYVYHSDGSEVDFAPVPIGLIGNTPASLEDIDGDGDFDIISGITTGAFIIDCKLPKGLKTPWKTYRGNLLRTGFYGDNELFTSIDENVPQVTKAVLNQNYPNPFNPTTTISFSLPENSSVELNIYNIKGQKVRSLLDDQRDKSSHSIVWNGKNDNGNSVSSGIYFYKLEANNRMIDTKKCVLLK